MAVSDLTNTKWLLNTTFTTAVNGWSFSDEYGYSDSLHINFTSNNEVFDILHMYDDDGSGGAQIEYILYEPYTSRKYWGIRSGANQTYQTITITGGQDVTNASLIAWLEANATQQVAPTGKTQLGTRTITKKMLGTREITKEVVNGVVVYEKQASLPTFTGTNVGGYVYGPYQFEQGMTFAQWVASAYNTDGWVVGAYNKIVLDGIAYLRKGSFTDVVSTDVVEALNYYVYLDN